jgi:hypothetical protein
MADDGTLLLFPGCAPGGRCRVLVRAPLPIGDPNAWRALTDGDLYRVLPGGAVLYLRAEPRAGATQKVAVLVDTPGRPPQHLIDLTLDAPLEAVDIVRGTLVLGFASGRRHTVAADGARLPPPP